MASREFNIRKWRRIISDYRKTSQTLKSYCGSVKVSTKSFYYWQRKLTSLEESEGNSAFNELAFKEEDFTSRDLLEGSSCLSGIRIHIGKFRIEVDKEFDVVEFRKAAGILMGM